MTVSSGESEDDIEGDTESHAAARVEEMPDSEGAERNERERAKRSIFTSLMGMTLLGDDLTHAQLSLLQILLVVAYLQYSPVIRSHT